MSDSKQQQQSKEDADHHQTPNPLLCNEDKSPRCVVKQQTSLQGSAAGAGAGGAVCGVCKRLYRDPKILPCLHTFCSECIVQLEPFSVSQQQGTTGTKKTTPSTSNTNRLAAATRTSSSSSSSRSSSNGSEDPPPSSLHHHHVRDRKTSVLCPECDTEVDIPPSGVGGLSTDHLALDAVFSETLMADGPMVCDLCSDGDAERRCEVCSVNLCEFCSQAHRRQKRTASHTVRCLQELKGQTGRVSRPVLCSFHPGQELRLFCEPCDLPVCIECSATFHRDPSQHRCCPARDVIDRHGGRIRQLVSGCLRPRLERLEEALRKVEVSQETLHTRVEAVAVEVRAFARGYANAVETHCVSLLRRLEEVRVQRRNQLHLQKAQLQQALADVRGGVDFAERLLTSGSEAEILSAKGVTLRRLGGLAETGYDPAHPTATGGRGAAAPPGLGPDDDGSSICFLPREGAGEIQGFPVVGVIYSKTLDLSRCTIEGEGLQQGREGQQGAFSLVCRDSAGEHMGRGGDNVLVSIIHKDKKDCTVEAAVVDNCDGSYAVSYTPVEPGLYSVWVCVKAQHVKGSPFVLSVQRKLRRHRGTFHCCSFCSGGGSKQSQCGCPGTMPGGFQGCGHGHKGHPGKPHWSCCGSTAEQSECLPRSIMAAVSPRGRLRTVEL